MKIRKSKYHQKSVKVVHCGALIWRKFSTNCDAHLAESFFQTRSRHRMNGKTMTGLDVLCSVTQMN